LANTNFPLPVGNSSRNKLAFVSLPYGNALLPSHFSKNRKEYKMSNTELQKAYGTIIDFYKDTYQREYVANKLLENVNYSITKTKENLDKKQTEWLNEYENCEHTGQSTEKLGQLERVCHQYIPQNLENLTDTKTAIEKAMASLGINQKVTKTLDNHIDPRKLINQRPDTANKQKSTKVVV
tara:strand:- start:1084 stop:1626 length:543 start_codon:yes stop_codon:yes gene_type:complete